MPEPLITSSSNPLVKRLRSLQQRKTRQQQGVFFVEGVQTVWQAVESGAVIETLIVAPDLLTSAPAWEVVKRQRAAGTPTVHLGRALFESVAERAHASGLAAIVRMQSRGLEQFGVGPDALFVAFHDVQYPGNLGTILRTVDAVGGSGVILIGETTDPYHPQAVKASVGALFTVPVVRVKTVDSLLTWCDRQGVQVVTTSPQASLPYWSTAYPLPALFMFGSEGHGLPESVLRRGQAVQIPMAGRTDSLNLALATGVLLYEVRRQQAHGHGVYQELA